MCILHRQNRTPSANSFRFLGDRISFSHHKNLLRCGFFFRRRRRSLARFFSFQNKRNKSRRRSERKNGDESIPDFPSFPNRDSSSPLPFPQRTGTRPD